MEFENVLANGMVTKTLRLKILSCPYCSSFLKISVLAGIRSIETKIIDKIYLHYDLLLFLPSETLGNLIILRNIFSSTSLSFYTL